MRGTKRVVWSSAHRALVGPYLAQSIAAVAVVVLLAGSYGALNIGAISDTALVRSSVAAGPPNPYYVYGYVHVKTNTSLTVANGVTVWINDTTTPAASGTAVTDTLGKYQLSSLGTGYANGNTIKSTSHQFTNLTGSNTTTVNTAHPGSWLNVTMAYPQLTPHLSANVTSGEAPTWVELFNNRTAAPTLGGNGSYTFSWVFGDGTADVWNQAAPSFDHEYTTTGAWCARLIVNDTAGDSWETPCLTITINTPPSLTSFSDSPLAVNLTSATAFTTVESGGTAPFTYQYQFGQNGAVLNPTTSLTTNVTSYTYTKVTNSSVEANVTVKDHVSKVTSALHVPAWVYDINIHATPNVADANQPVTISGTALGGTGGTDFTWFFAYGDGGKSATLCSGKALCSVSHIYTSAATYTLSLLLNDTPTNSITATSEAVTVAVSISIKVNTALTAAIAVNRSYVDVNQPVKLTGTAGGGTTPYVFFLFNNGNGVNNNVTQGTSPATWSGVTYALPSTYDPLVRIGDTSGMNAISSSTSVVVNATPTIAISVTGYLGAATSAGYVGESLTLKATTTAGVPSFSIKLVFGDTNTYTGSCDANGCSVSDPHSYASAGTYTVHAWLNDSGGGSTVASTTVTIYKALSAPALVANRTAGEIDLSVSFNASVTGGVPGLTFAWQFGDAGVVTVQGQLSGSTNNQIHNYIVARNATVNVTVNDTQGESDVLHIHIFAYPDLSLTFTSTTSNANHNPPVNATFTAHPSGGSGSYKYYNWTFGNGATANELTAVTPVETFWNSGVWSVKLLLTDNVSDKFLLTSTFTVYGTNQTLGLSTGWNLISMPDANESFTLWSLYHYLSTVEGLAGVSVSVQNVSGAGNETYPGGLAYAAAYSVSPGRGVWVDTTSAATNIKLSGNMTTGPLFPKLTLQAGWNNLGWSLSGASTASGVATLIGSGVSALSMWNAATQAYVTYIVGFSDPSYNFNIAAGTGILVWVATATTFSE